MVSPLSPPHSLVVRAFHRCAAGPLICSLVPAFVPLSVSRLRVAPLRPSSLRIPFHPLALLFVSPAFLSAPSLCTVIRIFCSVFYIFHCVLVGLCVPRHTFWPNGAMMMTLSVLCFTLLSFPLSIGVNVSAELKRATMTMLAFGTSRVRGVGFGFHVGMSACRHVGVSYVCFATSFCNPSVARRWHAASYIR